MKNTLVAMAAVLFFTAAWSQACDCIVAWRDYFDVNFAKKIAVNQR